MPNIKSVGLTRKTKQMIKKRVIQMRDRTRPPVPWYSIAKRFDGIGVTTIKNLYEEAKNGQKRKA